MFWKMNLLESISDICSSRIVYDQSVAYLLSINGYFSKSFNV